MKKLVLAALVMAGLALPASNAQAATIGSTPASNNILGITEGWFGANLYLVGGPAVITVTYLGKEAGYNNTFFLDGTAGDVTFSTGAAGQVGPQNVVMGNATVNSGLIPFWFMANNILADTVYNTGINPVPSNVTPRPNFFVTLGGALDTTVNNSTPNSGTVAWIAFDDAGAGPDDNHDDLVVKFTLDGGYFTVPEGGSALALLGCALVGLGALRRKFNA